jgi:hypothetical protein
MTDKRHQVEDREEFTESQKMMIAKKSNNCCAWCGRKVYFGYGGTVDHFIPLKKGGTNDFKNLVLMCQNCNEKKGSMIIPVSVAGYHVQEPYKAELESYFDEYIESFDYVSRGNLLCCDVYALYVMPEEFASMRSNQRKKGKKPSYTYKQAQYLLRRAYPSDIEKITSFYTKYLIKYGMLASEEAALENIKFWMRFGVIYYIERSDEIALVGTGLVNRHEYISINLFSYYSTVIATTLARGFVTCISEAIIAENRLPYLPISVNMLHNDTLIGRVMKHRNSYILIDNRLDCVPYWVYNPKLPTDKELRKQELDEGRSRIERFFKRFRDIEDQVRLYLHEGDLWDFEWMANEILERDLYSECQVVNPF